MEKPGSDKKTSNDNGFKITGDWQALSDVIKEKFPRLNDADLQYTEGNEEALLERIAAKLGKQRGEVVMIIRKASNEVKS